MIRQWRRKVSRGVSIVEILVALAILTFGVYAIYEQFINAGSRSRDQVTRAQARYLAHQQLVQLLACNYDELSAWTPPAGAQPIPDNIKFFSRPAVQRRPDGLLDVSIHVGWNVRQVDGEFQPGNSVVVKGVKSR